MCVLVYQAVFWVWVSTGTHLPRLMLVRLSYPWIHPCLSAYMCCEASLAELQTTQGRQLIVCIQPFGEESGKANTPRCVFCVNVSSHLVVINKKSSNYHKQR